jgi:probable aminopeptidase NPEPL1
VATGKRHAAIVSNLESLEQAAVEAGRLSGDTCHPLPFAPELFRDEFASKIADLKNSVADRNNAQSACAASFVYEHLHPSYKGGWLHVDLAGPAWLEERGTGYGVGLLLGLLQVEGFRAMGRDVRDGGKIW